VRNQLRLSFSGATPEQITEGIRRLAAVLIEESQ
jgi:DNA-binding transcriptional MocR family regulator